MTMPPLWATLTTLSGPAPGGAGDPHAACWLSPGRICGPLRPAVRPAEGAGRGGGGSGPVRAGGGGSVPTQLLPTFAVALPADKLSPNQAEQALRCREKPIIGRITEGRLLLDVRTIFPEDMEYIADTAAEVLA